MYCLYENLDVYPLENQDFDPPHPLQFPILSVVGVWNIVVLNFTFTF